LNKKDNLRKRLFLKIKETICECQGEPQNFGRRGGLETPENLLTSLLLKSPNKQVGLDKTTYSFFKVR
jgi:hypothetical protein